MTNTLFETTKNHHRRTKIIATVGPASRSPERIRELIQAGVNVFRLNFSHGSYQEHGESLATIREVSKELGAYVAVLQDLSGPKIRITQVTGDYLQIHDGAVIELRTARAKTDMSDGAVLYVEGISPTQIMQAGQQVLLADGIIELRAEQVSPDYVVCSVQKGGRLRSRVGIAFPESHIDLPAATEKDIKDLGWGIEHNIDFAAVSFVQNAADILRLRQVLTAQKSDIRIIAKIERRSALDNIFEIMDVVDGVMVARGDLGLELPLEQLPMLQRRLIEQANYRGIPVIVATQMLHSMISAVRPTRAEVSDIATAVMSGADAVMLSEETAIGEHPVAAVQYLARIAEAAESTFAFEEFRLRLRDSDRATVTDAVAYAACAAGVKVNASVIIACTETGTSARLVAKYRPQQPLYGTSSNVATLRRMNLLWGVIPVSCGATSSHSDEMETAIRTVMERENLPDGTRAVIIGGLSVGKPGATNVLEVRELRR